MKRTLLLALPISALVSCTKTQVTEPAAPAAAESNPYGVPGGDLSNSPEAAAYQPIDPINPPASVPAVAPVPSVAPTPVTPLPNATSHLVTTGDTLWGLSRKYGVSIEALQQANGLTTTQINTGQTLSIPAR